MAVKKVFLRNGKGIVAFGVKALQEFWHYQGISQAAALGFYALLSFIPLLYLIVAVAGMIWGDTVELQAFFERQDTLMLPWIKETIDTRLDALLQLAPGLGWMSLGFIVWTSGLFFAVLQSSLLLPWARTRRHRKGVWRWALPWILGPALGFVLPVAMLLMHLAGYLPNWLPMQSLSALGSWFVFFVGIMTVYKLFMPLNCSWTKVVLLSLLISCASLALTLLFSQILSSLPNYTRIYGSLAGIVLFLLWLEYNMSVILWGGHLLRLLEERHEEKRTFPASPDAERC